MDSKLKDTNQLFGLMLYIVFHPTACKGLGIIIDRAGRRATRQTKPPLVHWYSHIFQSIFKHGRDIYSPKISDEFIYGGSASLNMYVMDLLMSPSLITFGMSGFLLKKCQLPCVPFHCQVCLHLILKFQNDSFSNSHIICQYMILLIQSDCIAFPNASLQNLKAMK